LGRAPAPLALRSGRARALRQRFAKRAVVKDQCLSGAKRKPQNPAPNNRMIAAFDHPVAGAVEPGEGIGQNWLPFFIALWRDGKAAAIPGKAQSQVVLVAGEHVNDKMRGGAEQSMPA